MERAESEMYTRKKVALQAPGVRGDSKKKRGKKEETRSRLPTTRAGPKNI